MNKIEQFGKKISLIVTILVSIAIICITIISFYRNRVSIDENYTQQATQINNLFALQINNKLSSITKDLKNITSKNQNFTIPYFQLKKSINSNPEYLNKYAEHTNYFKKEIFQSLYQQPEIEDIYMISTTSAEPITVFQYSNSSISNKPKKFKNLDNEVINTHVKVSNINHPIIESNEYYTYITEPIFIEDVFIGMIILKTKLSEIADKIDFSAYEKDQEIISELVKLEKGNIYTLYTNRDSLTKTNNELYDLLANNWMKDEISFSKHKDGRKRSFNSWTFDSKIGICILTKIELNKNIYNKGNFNSITLLIGLGIIGLSILLSNFFARTLSYPIIKLKKVLNLISNGVLPKKLNTPLQDEVGDMIRTVNKIVESLKKTAGFAQKIGQGDFDTDFKPISRQDILGNSLVEMKNSLKTANSKDEIRNWIIEGLASMGSILRNHDNIKEISEEVIEFICDRVNALQGAFFLSEQKEGKVVLNLKSTYAYSKQKNLDRSFALGEGIIGQAAFEKNVIMRSEIPDKYTIINSGLLGEKHPSHLLVVPLLYNDEVYGVIELASFTVFESDVIEFMEEVGAIISRTIFNINVNEETKNLLEKSQRLSSELTENKEQLEANAYLMEQSQIEVTQMNKQLQEQIVKVKEAQERQNALLTNSEEVIFILDQKGFVNYVSPSIFQILGYTEEDILGTKDIKRIKNKYVEAVNMFSTSLIQNPKTTQSIQYEYYKKNGESVWLEAFGTNQVKNPAINGLVINVIDITIKRQAEEEQRKRSQMQSLSENSTDLILRIGLDKQIFYVNPIITFYTGKSPNYLLGKSIEGTLLNKHVNNAYVELLNIVEQTQELSEIEADFSDQVKSEIFSIKGIPEFDNNGKLESVLMISHNVTKEKTIQRDIKEKNKQIEDSIYYAENIQNILLPDTSTIQKHIPNSFVIFKPRDIVSGDFPWFKEHNGYLYLAAVDCTGHGVPGAMIATVGYFLLNGILLDKKTPDSGEVLDQLNDLVTSTFRQNDENSNLKDGMDMVMCRINLSTDEIDIASANRPIYQINKQNELIEIKGNKFPIGGGTAYNNRINFTNHKIDTKDSSIYFFSDGLQDQFDETKTKKFGTRQIKSILMDNHKQGANTTQEKLEEAYQKWKGKNEQTDDILFIGIDF